MKNLLFILFAVFISACGAKKRIVHIERGAEVVKEERNVASEETSRVIDIDTSKIKTKTSERSYGSVVEKWVWGESGSPVSYTKTVISSGKIKTEVEELKGIVSDSSNTAKITDLSVLEKKTESEVIDDNLDRESSAPFAWGGIFGTIIGLGIALWLGLRLLRYMK